MYVSGFHEISGRIVKCKTFLAEVNRNLHSLYMNQPTADILVLGGLPSWLHWSGDLALKKTFIKIK